MDQLQELITQVLASLADGEACHVEVKATIARVALAGGDDSVLDVNLVARVDQRLVSRRVAVRASDGAVKAWSALDDAATAVVSDHLDVVKAAAKAKTDTASPAADVEVAAAP